MPHGDLFTLQRSRITYPYNAWAPDVHGVHGLALVTMCHMVTYLHCGAVELRTHAAHGYQVLMRCLRVVIARFVITIEIVI